MSGFLSRASSRLDSLQSQLLTRRASGINATDQQQASRSSSASSTPSQSRAASVIESAVGDDGTKDGRLSGSQDRGKTKTRFRENSPDGLRTDWGGQDGNRANESPSGLPPSMNSVDGMKGGRSRGWFGKGKGLDMDRTITFYEPGGYDADRREGDDSKNDRKLGSEFVCNCTTLYQ